MKDINPDVLTAAAQVLNCFTTPSYMKPQILTMTNMNTYERSSYRDLPRSELFNQPINQDIYKLGEPGKKPMKKRFVDFIKSLPQKIVNIFCHPWESIKKLGEAALVFVINRAIDQIKNHTLGLSLKDDIKVCVRLTVDFAIDQVFTQYLPGLSVLVGVPVRFLAGYVVGPMVDFISWISNKIRESIHSYKSRITYDKPLVTSYMIMNVHSNSLPSSLLMN
ncbi:hypothetical protein GDO81_011415 [Engystomops pustulosus]|uniref:Uncharacterized protein n=1 Tax=Engystomops pustulosus TaxID=76066 RepID=A0AAV7BE37_ENGPU|nr:hypothetical protein GDO81_011415 [Engystomops pustulosus]